MTINTNQTFVLPDGSVSFGFFENSVGRLNYEDFSLRSPCREQLPTDERLRRFVHFNFMGFTSDRFISGCSLSYANKQTTVFFYVFDRHKKTILKRGCRARSGDITDINLSPDDGISHIMGKGMDVQFISSPGNREKTLIVKLDGSDVLTLSFQEQEPPFDTLRLCTPVGPNGWSYCQKVAGLKASGTLTLDGEEHDLRHQNAYAHHDFTGGYLRQDTFWNWACFTGQGDHGKALGLNLSNGVNETGHSENVIWRDGKRQSLGLATFAYDPNDLTKKWTIRTADLGVDLTFLPDGQYAAFQPDGPTPVDFTQLFGTFNGRVTLADGETVSVRQIPGFCERQYSVWYP
ncbi:DUF2804 domain-containing protein [Sneathiella aquimaris]|uniref:DUF2804 domain-containing protein n=1 Tax=Sneathiella aquimaris TaxID=2599305 RepID=UPI00146E02CB|nr:DUF2804 domain-containing protein [Sneathiella aquimaris]